ncbi:glutathione S-transferase [Xylariaceae sp. FL0255]|nr:glutathione S-transferase [Xylariaceae sp. FL0255]
MTKPVCVWITTQMPHPWKVILILAELKLPFEIMVFRTEDTEEPPFSTLNPNGSIPAIEDPNTGIVLWESGAIITYIIEQYDKDLRLTYAEDRLQDRHALNQWLHFQMSEQGPFLSLAGWLNHCHPEKLPSIQVLINDECMRQLRVLNSVLENKDWLVGEKMTYADLALVPWNDVLHQYIPMTIEERFAEFPNVKAWHERMISLPSWKRLVGIREKTMKEINELDLLPTENE